MEAGEHPTRPLSIDGSDHSIMDAITSKQEPEHKTPRLLMAISFFCHIHSYYVIFMLAQGSIII